MLPYYFLIFFPFFLEAVENMLQSNRGYVFNTKSSNNSITVFFAILFAMLSLRSISCGTDLWNYQYTFGWVAKLNFSECLKKQTLEPLYIVFNWIISRIYCDFRFLLVVIAFMCTGITGWFYWKESKCPLLTILLFVISPCFSMFYSGLRQALAMLFVVPAYYMMLRKKNNTIHYACFLSILFSLVCNYYVFFISHILSAVKEQTLHSCPTACFCYILI